MIQSPLSALHHPSPPRSFYALRPPRNLIALALYALISTQAQAQAGPATCAVNQTFTTPNAATAIVDANKCVIPAGALNVTVTACGAVGGNVSGGFPKAGGMGASVSRTFNVVTGDVLGFAVGGNGFTGAASAVGAGGIGGGGNGGTGSSGGGGGWTGVFLNPSAFANLATAALDPSVQIIAGAGSGAGSNNDGANAGAAGIGGAQPGGANAGGTGTDSGSTGQGGSGTQQRGGGGGGGRYGGGAGVSTASGGGGSSYDGNFIATPTIADCGNSGNGKVTITALDSLRFATNTGTISTPAQTKAPANILSGATTPFGFYSFSVSGVGAGGTAVITITLPAGSTANSIVKCDNVATCRVVSPVTAGTSGGLPTLSYSITDGDVNDTDPTAGTIGDPVAPAVVAGSAAVGATGGGAFAPLMLGVLSVLGLMGLARRRWVRA